MKSFGVTRASRRLKAEDVSGSGRGHRRRPTHPRHPRSPSQRRRRRPLHRARKCTRTTSPVRSPGSMPSQWRSQAGRTGTGRRPASTTPPNHPRRSLHHGNCKPPTPVGLRHTSACHRGRPGTCKPGLPPLGTHPRYPLVRRSRPPEATHPCRPGTRSRSAGSASGTRSGVRRPSPRHAA